MGVEGSNDDEPLSPQSANPQNRYPLSAQLASNMPALRQWRPRDGRTKQFHLHMDSLVDAVIAHGWPPNILDYNMPQISQIKLAYPKANASRLEALLKDAIADHQEQNTLLFNMHKPSYVIDGEYELDDLEAINSFRDGLVADGRGLLRWALTWSDDSSFTAQAKIRKDFTAVELSVCKSVHMFHRQTRLLWELWCRTTYNSPDDPSPFWDHLVLLLPPAPTGSHLAQIRSRLAGQMADAHHTLSDPPRHLTKLENYALTIGMPEGSSSESKALFALNGHTPPGKPPPAGMKWAAGEDARVIAPSAIAPRASLPSMVVQRCASYARHRALTISAVARRCMWRSAASI